MKNYVKFNQGNFVKIGKEKNIKVDTVDGTLFDWIRTFMLSNKAMKKVIDNKLYIWVSYKAIREDNPLCHISSNDVVGRRLNKLIDLGLLEKFLSKEDGNKTFFCVTEFAYTYLLEDRELPTQKSEPLPTQKSDNSKLVYSELKDNKKINKKDETKSTKTITTTQTPLIVSEIVNHLNKVLNKRYKPNGSIIQKLIKAKLNQGFTPEDFQKVHIVKFAEWNGTEYQKYLRPETLYGTKFESYLNQELSEYEKAKAICKYRGITMQELMFEGEER